MKKTKRLFDRDPYQTMFRANVLNQDIDKEGNWTVILDQTAFYPQSGGQPHDVGYIDGKRVYDVQQKDGIIFHKLKEPVHEHSVIAEVDESRRIDHMQQHCGQHILSAAFLRLFGYETVSFHLGRRICSIDLNVPELTEADIIQTEDLTNKVITDDRIIQTLWYSRDDLERKQIKNVPHDQNVIRMVEISDFDLNACCGTHPARTGEIGIIKIDKIERHRGGTRVYFLCGKRALKLYQEEHETLQILAHKLRTNPDLLVEKSVQLIEENEQLRKKNRDDYHKLLRYEALEMVPSARMDIRGESVELYMNVSEQGSAQELKDLAKTLIEEPKRFIVFVKQKSEKLTWVLASSSSVSVKRVIQQLITLYGGKGGGSEVFGQWSGPWQDELSHNQIIQVINASVNNDE